jgi:hypothetical protein
VYVVSGSGQSWHAVWFWTTLMTLFAAENEPGTNGSDVLLEAVLTLVSTPAERREQLAAAGGDVVALDRLTPDVVVAELARRSLHRVLCEGGPTLFGELVTARRSALLIRERSRTDARSRRS